MARIQGEIIRSMSMLTINADQHPLMSQFHRPDDEKRSIVVIEPEYGMDWLTATPENAFKLLQPMGEGCLGLVRCQEQSERITAQIA